MQIHLSALGCRLNEAELERWSADFISRGHGLVTDPALADVLVLNTCAVTQEAVRKSRKSIQRLHKQSPTAKIVVSGCYVTLADTKEQASILGDLGVDLIINNQDKDQLAALTESHLGHLTMPEAATDPTASPLYQRNRQRAFIKIQDGCRYRCTFCIVTVARGDERSRTTQDIVAEINHLHTTGVQEIVLTGVHVGGYGSDLGTDLHSLIKAILTDTQIPRIRFASVEPWDLPPGFFQLFENPRLMPHMHLPLQSGSDTVLRRMARRCKTADFSALVNEIRSAIPGFTVTTDIIVGFPGETEDEFRESSDYVESIGFGHIHIFSYSVREGTKAARLDNQIHKSVKRERSQALHKIASESKKRCLQAAIGQQADVLWEGGKTNDAGQIQYFGYTPNYLRVTTTNDAGVSLTNAITRTTLAGLDSDNEHLLASSLDLLVQPELQTRQLEWDAASNTELLPKRTEEVRFMPPPIADKANSTVDRLVIPIKRCSPAD